MRELKEPREENTKLRGSANIYEEEAFKKKVWQRWTAQRGSQEAADEDCCSRRRSEPGEQRKRWTGGEKQEVRWSWRRSCQRAGRECLREEAAGAAEKIQWRGEVEKRADEAPALSEQRDFLKSWQRSAWQVTTMRPERPEPGEDNDEIRPSTVGGAITAVAPAGGDAGREVEEQSERADKQEIQHLKEETLKLQDHNDAKEKKKAVVLHI